MIHPRRGGGGVNLSSHSSGTPGTKQTFAPQALCLVFGCTFRAWRNDLCRNHAGTFEMVPGAVDRQTIASIEPRPAERRERAPRSSRPRRKARRPSERPKRPRIKGIRLAVCFFRALERVDGAAQANVAMRMALAAGGTLRRASALAAIAADDGDRLFVPWGFRSKNRSRRLFVAAYAAIEEAEGRGSYRRAWAAARAAGAHFRRGERERWRKAIAKDRPPPLPVILASILRAAAA